MAIRRCPYCKAIIDESQKYCNNCGTQLLFPLDESVEEDIKGEKIRDDDFRDAAPDADEFDKSLVPEDAEEAREEIDLEDVIGGGASLPDDDWDRPAEETPAAESRPAPPRKRASKRASAPEPEPAPAPASDPDAPRVPETGLPPGWEKEFATDLEPASTALPESDLGPAGKNEEKRRDASLVFDSWDTGEDGSGPGPADRPAGPESPALPPPRGDRRTSADSGPVREEQPAPFPDESVIEAVEPGEAARPADEAPDSEILAAMEAASFGARAASEPDDAIAPFAFPPREKAPAEELPVIPRPPLAGEEFDLGDKDEPGDVEPHDEDTRSGADSEEEKDYSNTREEIARLISALEKKNKLTPLSVEPGKTGAPYEETSGLPAWADPKKRAEVPAGSADEAPEGSDDGKSFVPGDTMDFEEEVLRDAGMKSSTRPTIGIPETPAKAGQPIEEEDAGLAPAPVARPKLGAFGLLRAGACDVLLVAVLWFAAVWLSARLLDVPLLTLVAQAVVPLGLLFAVLLAGYWFLFLFFLGETLGARLAAPKT